MVIYVLYVMLKIVTVVQLIILAQFASLGIISTLLLTLLIRFALLALLTTVRLALLIIFAKFVTLDIRVSQTVLASNVSIHVRLAFKMEPARHARLQISCLMSTLMETAI